MNKDRNKIQIKTKKEAKLKVTKKQRNNAINVDEQKTQRKTKE